VSGGSVYWTNLHGRSVEKVSISGGTTTILATAPSGTTGIAVDATSVYWGDVGGTLMKVTPK
jgi:hypothetical protein